MKTNICCAAFAAIGGAVLLTASMAGTSALQSTGDPVHVDNDDIGGAVTSAKGPEAGVWVIAETTDLPTRFAKIVVTDDRGRYVIPDLPSASYRVWVRGYGLVDSPKSRTTPGRILNLTATVASDARAAAEYYPASFWYSLLQPPAKNEFPGTGPTGNGISPNMKSQAQWLELVKTDSCWSCHQLGTKATREIPESLRNIESPVRAWDRRIQSGQAGGNMVGGINNLGKDRALAMFADWTSRIAAGELPPAPPRPQGVERNVVITEWDWATPKAYLHDEIATDKRNPTINANGLLYGAPELSTDEIPVLDPVRHTATRIRMPVRDPRTPAPGKPLQPSPYWGEGGLLGQPGEHAQPDVRRAGTRLVHVRDPSAGEPAYCKEGSSHPSAKAFPLARSGRQLAFYDPRTKQFTLIDTCFGTHHLQFAEDANQTLWTSSGGGGGVVGWLNRKMFDETHDEEKAQALDAARHRHQWQRQARRVRRAQRSHRSDEGQADQRRVLRRDRQSGRRVDLGVGARVPGLDRPAGARPGSVEHGAVRGLRAAMEQPEGRCAGLLAARARHRSQRRRVDRHRERPLRQLRSAQVQGPQRTDGNRQQCPEGWTLYPFPAPQFKGVTDSGSAEASYYDWVDQFDTFGLGRNTPIATGNGEDALLALVNGKWVVRRVPYPLGFFAKGLDGRIDDARTGWKGKGLWSTYATRTPFHTETGKGTSSRVLHFQLRPNPLAK